MFENVNKLIFYLLWSVKSPLKKKDSQALQVKNILNRGLSKISYNEINIKSKIIIQPALRCLCLVQVLNYLILLADHFATCHKILKIRGKISANANFKLDISRKYPETGLIM